MAKDKTFKSFKHCYDCEGKGKVPAHLRDGTVQPACMGSIPLYSRVGTTVWYLGKDDGVYEPTTMTCPTCKGTGHLPWEVSQ